MDVLSNPSRSWPFVLLRALSAIVFGLLALLLPGATLAALVLLFAAYMLADGVFALLAGARAVRRHERWGWFAVEGVLDLAAGVAALFWPGLTVLAFVAITAAWALLTGLAMLFGAFRFRLEHGRAWLVLGGVLSVVWGLLLALQPAAGALVMTLWLGAYALVFGIALLFLSQRLRREGRRLDAPSAAPHEPPSPQAHRI
ncbi:MAG TPA: DUF308 domain-containing protein [Ramlibacter sp.]|jgi:uncharacterized membrane protein HdeD (DUF308 family)|uniref:HdeD family acid-resistance protein n=1 Tax=Ramlibacter sp. TaxID=1917967 RepID=UPI002D5973F8|nr:DUF308 domain-containing protein [Ramlibacter sp.]HZY17324.1 DUF308 domain-containing protein [Ramlibacter sp.]